MKLHRKDIYACRDYVSIDVEAVVSFIVSKSNPEDLFDEEDLLSWAARNGFVKVKEE